MSQSQREILALHHQLERILQEFIREIRKLEDYPSSYIPPLDILSTRNCVYVFMDAPGLTVDNVTLSFKSGLLTIKGEKAWPACGGRQHHLLERTFGNFYRLVPIQEAVNGLEATATLEQGVLVVALPKVSERRRRTYEIPVEEQ